MSPMGRSPRSCCGKPKLSAAKSLQAVNLAGVANVALRQTRVGDLSMWKACAFSNAARNGVFAATLAQHGMTPGLPRSLKVTKGS